LDAISFGQLTPGPVSVTVTFVGYRMAGFLGAAVATIAIFLPAFFHMVTWFPRVVNWLSKQNWISEFTLGVTAAVVATIIVAVVPIAQGFSPGQMTLGLVLLVLTLSYPVPSWAVVILGGVANLLLVQTA
jgi:chromate transporter